MFSIKHTQKTMSSITPAHSLSGISWLSETATSLSQKTKYFVKKYLPEIALSGATLFTHLQASKKLFEGIYEYSAGKTNPIQWAEVIGYYAVAITLQVSLMRNCTNAFEIHQRASKTRRVISEIIENNKTEQKRDVVLLIETNWDENGSFFIENYLNKDAIQFLAKKFQLECLQPSSLQEITQKMETLQSEGKQVKHLIFQAHGNFSCIELDRNCSLSKEWIQPTCFPGLAPDAHIIFRSCLTGISDGIAEHFSRIFPKTTVFAQQGLGMSDRTWYCIKDGKPIVFNFSQNHDIITRVFKKGRPQTFPLIEDAAALEKSISDYSEESRERLKEEMAQFFHCSPKPNTSSVQECFSKEKVLHKELNKTACARFKAAASTPPPRSFDQIKKSAKKLEGKGIIENLGGIELSSNCSDWFLIALDFLHLLYNANLPSPWKVGELVGDEEKTVGSKEEQRKLCQSISEHLSKQLYVNSPESHMEALGHFAQLLERLKAKTIDRKTFDKLSKDMKKLEIFAYFSYVLGTKKDYADETSFTRFSDAIQEVLKKHKNLQAQIPSSWSTHIFRQVKAKTDL